jgi:hypothetical protein
MFKVLHSVPTAYLLRFSQCTVIITLNSINQLGCVMETVFRVRREQKLYVLFS